MARLRALLSFAVRYGVASFVLLVIGVLLYVVLTPPPRWSREGNARLNEFTHDGKWILLEASPANGTPSFEIVSAMTAETVFSVPFHGFSDSACAVSPDSRFVVVAAPERWLHFFDLESRQKRKTQLPERPGDCTELRFSPQGKHCIATVSPSIRVGSFIGPIALDHYSTVYEVESGKEVLTWQEPRNFIAATRDDELIFDCEDKREEQFVEVWKMTSPPTVRRFVGEKALELSPDGQTLLLGKGAAHLNLSTGQVRSTVRTAEADTLYERAPYRALVISGCWKHFTTDSKLLVFAHGSGKLICFWDVATGTRARDFPVEFTALLGCDLSPCGRTLLTEEPLEKSKSLIKLWNLETAELLFQGEHDDSQNGYYFTETNLVLYGGWDKLAYSAKTINLTTGVVAGPGKLFQWRQDALAIPVPLHQWRQACYKTLGFQAPVHWQVIDPATGQSLMELSTPHTLVDLAISKDSHTVATVEQTASGDRILRIWDAPLLRPWAWILGIPLALAALLALWRWRLQSRKRAVAA